MSDRIQLGLFFFSFFKCDLILFLVPVSFISEIYNIFHGIDLHQREGGMLRKWSFGDIASQSLHP